MSTAEYAPDDALVADTGTALPDPDLPFSEVFSEALRGAPCSVEGLPGGEEALPVHRWVREVTASDRAVLSHCHGATIDIGCGPGRMSAHLHEQGHAVLGVDIVMEAVEQARTRGVPALRRNIFDPIPGEGRWDTALLADGNIGIGGDPAALLRRCAELVDRVGRVVCDLAEPGVGLSVHDAALVAGNRRTKAFPWARVGADAIERVARRAGLDVEAVEQHGGRWFAVLRPHAA